MLCRECFCEITEDEAVYLTERYPMCESCHDEIQQSYLDELAVNHSGYVPTPKELRLRIEAARDKIGNSVHRDSKVKNSPPLPGTVFHEPRHTTKRQARQYKTNTTLLTS